MANDQYTDVAPDLVKAHSGYGANPGVLNWGGNVLPLTVNGANYHGIFLSFTKVNNPGHQFHDKHIAIMQMVEVPNTAIFVCCEDSYVEFRHGAYGTNPCLVTTNGDIIQQFSGYDYYFNGIVHKIPLEGGTSQGIAYYDYATNQIVWMDTVIGHNSPRYGGVRFTRTYVINGWVFGQSADGPDQILAYDLLSNKGYMVYNGASQVQPKGNVSGADVVCAISEPGMFISRAQFTPWNDVPDNNEFKRVIIEKLKNPLTQEECNYLINLVERDM